LVPSELNIFERINATQNIYMHTDNIKLTKISPADLKELQELGKKTFYESFAADNTAENMQYYLDTNFTDEKLSDEINNPESEFYFAKLHDKPIGYLKVNAGKAQTELQGNNSSLEIERIYVLKEFQGKKVGQILFDKALEIVKEKNADYIWLGVWEKNLKAIRFYEKNGFVQFDKHIFKLGDDEQTDIMMKLVLKK
jgi:diamine N-acetyltransferase